MAYTYTSFGKVKKEEHFDALGKKRFSLNYDYDNKENLFSESDAEGNTKIYSYDDNNNMKSISGPKPDQFKEITYDRANRPRVINERQTDGAYLVTTKEYDKLSRLVEEVDPCGNKTKYQYDAGGRVIKVIHPDGSEEQKEYDVLGNVIKEIDGKGYICKKTYNYRSQPTEIQYPDGSYELFEYEADGNLISHLDRNGAKTIYSYNALNQPIETNVYDPRGTLVKQTKATYSSFCLLSSIDGEGIETLYTHDKAGRVLAEECAGCKKQFAYDVLGRLTKTIIDDTAYIESFDFLERVSERRTEDQNGKILKQEKYRYDEAGNKTHVINSKGLMKTDYNAQNLPLVKKDPLGNETHYVYEYKTDLIISLKLPNGVVTSERKDFRGNILEYNKRSKKGEVIQRGTRKYDKNGNLEEEELQVFDGSLLLKMVVNKWSYGPMNRVEQLIESGKKVTEYEYDERGKLHIKIKPDCTELYYSYDIFGRLERYWSDDFDYTYTYDRNDHVTKVYDKTADTETTRIYDSLGHITFEKQANGLCLKRTYDTFGRKREIILPDESNIEFTYKNDFLFEVKRDDKVHTYVERDLEGKVVEAKLPSNKGTLKITRDALSRWESFTTPYYTAIFANSYDSVGNLMHYDFVDRQGSMKSEYQYDDLNQLISENDHTYKYDSINNRLIKDEYKYNINDLNQIINDGDTGYTYDDNGNMKSDGEHIFKYDSQDRLIEVQSEGRTIKYTYDSFHRRQTKELEGKKELYLWDEGKEIGLINKDKILQLRILGEGLGAEVGAAVLIELEGESYIPIHDHRGCLVELIGLRSEGETNRYIAFGEEVTEKRKSPWRFCSKRFDEETGLIFFGRRYYSPVLGRWISTDPEGFRDGPNLYAYVHNGPMTCVDLYGLKAVQSYSSIERKFDFRSFNFFVNAFSERSIAPGFINGLNNEWHEAYKTAGYFAKSIGSNMHGTYAASGDFVSEVYKGVLNLMGMRMPAVKRLHEQWDRHFEKNPGIPFLQYCHSNGATDVEHGLRDYPKHLRKDIMVVALAPACYVDPKLCRSVVHYVSENDFVPWFDSGGRKKYGDTVKVLKPHPDAPFWDHTVLSPTYKEPIEFEGRKYFDMLWNQYEIQ